MSQRFIVNPGGSLSGELRVPGDKSISHRAAIFAGLAEGTSRITGFLQGEDCLASLRAMQQLGVCVVDEADAGLAITGCGGMPSAPREPIDVGNAGTGMRLLAGVLAGQDFKSVLTGDESLRTRPMQRIIEPLTMMGAEISSSNGRAPLNIAGRSPLKAIDYLLPIASAQVQSCVLLAALFANGPTSVTSPAVVRDHTERMLCAMGVDVKTQGLNTTLHGPAILKAADIAVPGDFSSAAFFIAAASAMPGASAKFPGVGVNPGRTGLLDILREMGADIAISNQQTVGGEAIADISVRGRQLHGINVDPGLVPAAVDEFPVLFVVAAVAEGTTTVTGAAELRVKESDRITVMATALASMGITVRERQDGLEIEGAGSLSGGNLDCAGDHRVAMALALCGLWAREPIIISNVENVVTSYPGFVEDAASLGLDIRLPAGEGEMKKSGARSATSTAAAAKPTVPVVAVDGPSGSGKGTISRLLAENLGWHLLDSGALYRLTALAALEAGIDPGDETAVANVASRLDVRFETDEAGNERILLDGQDVTARIRSERCGAAASRVAPLAEVRKALSALQLGFRRPPGLVADGRDMGTVIFPDARLKIFLTASADERAERRYKQLNEKGIGVSLAALREEIAERDKRDRGRAIAPLVPASDALVIDTTGVDIDSVLNQVLEEAKRAFGN